MQLMAGFLLQFVSAGAGHSVASSIEAYLDTSAAVQYCTSRLLPQLPQCLSGTSISRITSHEPLRRAGFDLPNFSMCQVLRSRTWRSG